MDAVLDSEKQRKLNELGMIWDKNKERDDLFIDAAESYYKANGDINIPLSYTVDGVKLGKWISNIRSKRKHPMANNMILDEKRIRMLNEIGMNWK